MSQLTSSNLVELSQWRAENYRLSTPAYRFISREGEKLELSYVKLNMRAKAIAAALQDIKAKNQRALLLYMPGLDYIEAFFGCLYAGVVAVPAYPPDPQRLSRTLPRLLNIIQDSSSYVIMSTSFIEGMAKELFINQQKNDLKWLSSDIIPDEKAKEWKDPKIEKNSLAFLQYTSGSTSNPRGVMLTHQNLLSNLELIKNEIPKMQNSIGVSWLPPYHDMGLIGGILQPMHADMPVVLMSPIDFLVEPYVWLKAISDYQATMSGGPNFAYELCVKRINKDQRDGLDLSKWIIAANGAEPIRHESMEKFANYFAPAGFRKEAFLPCYGLAETTLYVCSHVSSKPWTRLDVDAKSLEEGRVEAAHTNKISRTLVGCGKPLSDQEIYIVDKDYKNILSENCVGEIWVRHSSVAQGYFNQPEKTKETFGAFLANGEGPFLRTGDLGFLKNGELFITGRQKDVIIIRGRNHYPQDIEKTAEECHENVRFGCIAAVSLQKNEQEELGIVLEIKNKDLADETIEAIKNAVSLEHGLIIQTIGLIEAKSIPKTSSGKIQRHASKEILLSNSSELIQVWHAHQKNNTGVKHEVKNILPLVQTCVVNVLGLEKSENVNLDETLVSFGLDSLMRQELIGALEKIANQPLVSLVIDEKTTIRSLAESLKQFSLEDVRKQNTKLQTNQQTIAPEYTDFAQFTGYLALKEQLKNLELVGLKNPFFTQHDGLVQDTTQVNGNTLINFSNYNYVGMAGHPEVSKAAKEAIDCYGTSVSASRLVSGERPLHVNLERKIAKWIGVDDSIVYVSGHATNVSTIGHLFSEGDLIVHDSLSHNSIQLGCKLSNAKILPFPHNDYKSLDRILAQYRNQYKRALVVIEGIYSMDGDIPDLPKYIEIKKRHNAFLMVDEAHSIGVLGKHGRGLAEHAQINPKDVDLWMGTLSKSFASCGGYIAGCKEVIDYLRYSSPAFVYSVGLPPPNAAASLKAIEILENEPERIEQLKFNSDLFLNLSKENGLNTGLSKNSPIIPIIIGNSLKALFLSEKLLENGINALPIIYPAVEDNLSRLRFFITSCHNEKQIRQTVKTLTKEVETCASL